MWPLALAEGEPPILTLQDDIYEFPCAWKRGGRPKKLYPDIADNVRATFGEAFLAKLNDAIADRVATSVTKAT
jgi:hypothetical protein